MATFLDYAKNIFWLLLLLQVAPPLIKSIGQQYADLLEPKAKVGVIDISGTLTQGTQYMRDLKAFFENDEIKAIVLKIDSTGGSAGTAQAIFNEIKLLRNQYSDKYTIAYIENVAASGAYYVAAATHYIIASPAAFIGSIGSYISHPYVKDFIEHYKLQFNLVKSGTYKTIGSPFTELTPEYRAELQALTDNVYQQFVKDIAEQRPGLPADSKKWADGKLFTGQQAASPTLKLIDELGSPSTVVKIIREQAHIEGKIEWVRPDKKTSLLSRLFNPEPTDGSSYLSACITSVCQHLESRYCSGVQA
jgi:protease-4